MDRRKQDHRTKRRARKRGRADQAAGFKTTEEGIEGAAPKRALPRFIEPERPYCKTHKTYFCPCTGNIRYSPKEKELYLKGEHTFRK